MQGVVVTQGGSGCAIYYNDSFWEVKALPSRVDSAVGAGDAFAAAFLHGLHRGWDLEKVGAFANALGAFVVGKPEAIPAYEVEDILAKI
jgi:sugar/nucleoside kinase (ribokinase family)